MAPIPEHFKRPVPVDLSSQILGKVGEASYKNLTASAAGTWVAELESSIQDTKDKICQRIQQELPDFNRQLESSKSVQTRLGNLTSNVNALEGRLSDPQAGLLPSLLRALKAHNELAQKTSDARVAHDALAFLKRCRESFGTLTDTVQQGKLEEGVKQADDLGTLLAEAPTAVSKAQLMSDLKGQLRSLRDRISEQLLDAYSRSILVSSTEFCVAHTVQVRQSTSTIGLTGILSSLSNESLATHTAPLLRDITRHYLDFPFQQPVSAEVSTSTATDGTPIVCLSIFPLSPSVESRRPSLLYLKIFFDFLNTHLLPSFPGTSAQSLLANLRQRASQGLVETTIRNALPSSLTDLNDFLEFLNEAVEFERRYLLGTSPGLSPTSPVQGAVREWTSNVAEHFGTKRRTEHLSSVRSLILSTAKGPLIRVEAPLSATGNSADPVGYDISPPLVIPVQGDDEFDGEGDAWDFEDDTKREGMEENGSTKAPVVDEKANDGDGWDFDDDVGDTSIAGDDPWADSNDGSDSHTPANGNGILNGNGVHTKPYSAQDQDESAWDSTWDDEPAAEVKTASSSSSPAAPMKAPRVAKGLEKLTSKAKQKDQGRVSPSPSTSTSSRLSAAFPLPSSSSAFGSSTLVSPNPSNFSASPRSPLSSSYSPLTTKRSDNALAPKPSPLPLSQPPQLKEPETYLVSGRAQDLIKQIFRILDEGNTVSHSSIFSISCEDAQEAATTASGILSEAAPGSLALFRAVYPVAHAPELAHSTRALRFSNECAYIAGEIERCIGKAREGKGSVRELLKDEVDRLEELGVWWYEEGIEHECTRLSRILERAEDFVDMGDEERYDTCEGVVTEILRSVRALSNEWKPVLSRTQHLTATGRIVEHALTHVLNAILALPDIPEVDSRRLAELCRVLAALEGLFIVDEPSADGETNSMVVAYVPSWLKFSYLSELLEASLADVSYLFEQGALIDFDVDELIPLVRALFADTPARSNAIAKLQRGHPQPQPGASA